MTTLIKPTSEYNNLGEPVSRKKEANPTKENGVIIPGLSAPEDEVVLKNGKTNVVVSTTRKQIYTQLLQLKFTLSEYIRSNKFDAALSFGYFLNEYIRGQNKLDKHFALEIGVKHAAISQYLNNRRKPTKEFLIRLELHSNGLFPAINWLRLLQKEKENEIVMDIKTREQEFKHIKKSLDFECGEYPG